jgi:hypothetical protein
LELFVIEGAEDTAIGTSLLSCTGDSPVAGTSQGAGKVAIWEKRPCNELGTGIPVASDQWVTDMRQPMNGAETRIN